MEVVAQLIESPWDAKDLLAPLSKKERTAVRDALMKRVAKKPDGEAVRALGAFADTEVLGVLQKIVTKSRSEEVCEAAAEAIGDMETKASAAALRDLVEHRFDGVARIAIENLADKPAAVLALLLPRIDRLAKRGDDLLLLAVVRRLVDAAPKNKAVLEAIARHWTFAIVHETTLMATNAIFDALVDHAPTSPVARAVFEAAAAHPSEYARVRGHAALALTTDDITTHVTAMNKMTNIQPSTGSLRKKALAQLVATRKPALQALANKGDKVAARLLK